MLFLPKKQLPVIGVDISATAVKLLELSKTASTYKVESYSVEPLPAGCVEDKVVVNVEMVGEAIGRMVKKAKTKTKDAASAVSGPSVITKIVSVPGYLKDRELEEQMKIEAEQNIPFPIEDVVIDFEILKPSGEDPDNNDVMLVVSKSDIVDACVGALELGGLTPKIIDIEAFAMEKAVNLLSNQLFAGAEGNKVIAVADVGSVATTFIVMENMQTIYSREQSFGGAQLTEEIQHFYGLSFEEAGAAKRKGGLPDNYTEQVLGPFKESMAQQIVRAQQFFYSSSGLDRIDHIILAGGCSSIPDIDKVVEQYTSVPTSKANPFARMNVASRVNKTALYNDSPAMMMACGLALRRVG